MNGPSKKDFVIFAIIAAIFFAILSSFWGDSVFVHFQSRDLHRAHLLAQGHPIFFGPESSGGGALPGGFYYYLLALPMALGFGWQGAWVFMVFLASLSIASIWSFCQKRFGFLSACTASVIYVSFLPFLFELTLFYNPSFVILPGILITFGLLSSFAEGSGRAWLLTCAAIALALQIHFTAIFLLVAGLVLQAGARRFGIKPLDQRVFWNGLGILLAILSPYFIWQIFRHFSIPLGQALPAASGTALHVWDWLLKAQLMKFSTNRTPFHFVVFWVEAVCPCVCVAIAFARKRKPIDTPSRRTLTVLFVVSALTALPAVYLFINFLGRYALIFSACFSLLMGALFHLIRPADHKKASLAVGGILVVLSIIHWHHYGFHVDQLLTSLIGGCVLAVAWVLGLPQPLRKLRPSWAFIFLGAASLAYSMIILASEGMVLRGFDQEISVRGFSFDQYEVMSDFIYRQTGWDYERAARRIYTINGYLASTPEFIYRSTVEKIGTEKIGLVQVPEHPVDGFFVAYPDQWNKWDPSQNAKTWLLAQPLPPDVLRGLTSGGIELESPRLSSNLLLFPYKILDHDHLPATFQNGGEPYGGDVPDHLPESSVRFNQCPGQEPYCDIAFVLDKVHGKIHVTIFGKSISQSTEWIVPEWTEQISKPYINFSCSGSAKKILLAETIGYHSPYERALLAPMEWELTPPCPAIDKISFGFEGATAIKQADSLSLPGAERAVPLF